MRKVLMDECGFKGRKAKHDASSTRKGRGLEDGWSDGWGILYMRDATVERRFNVLSMWDNMMGLRKSVRRKNMKPPGWVGCHLFILPICLVSI